MAIKTQKPIEKTKSNQNQIKPIAIATPNSGNHGNPQNQNQTKPRQPSTPPP